MATYNPKSVSAYERSLVNAGKVAPKGSNLHVEPTPNNTELEQRYVSSEIQGIEQAYFTGSFGSDEPDYSEQVGAKFVKSHDNNGVFIGSLLLNLPYVRHEELDPTDINKCVDWKLSLPSFCNPEGVVNLIDLLIPKDSSSLTWKTIEDINKIADEVDNVPEARIIIDILSQNYYRISDEIKAKFTPQLKDVILTYVTRPTPDKEPEYEDLSAYLNAPFPRINLENPEENDELKKLLDSLEKLGLEDLDIPIVEVNNKDLTDRTVDGTGTFDFIATSILNQLLAVRKNNLITQNEIASIYSTFLVQGIQTASQFALEKASIKNQSYSLKVQAAQASVAVLQAKAEMLMLPAKMRLAYAEVEAKLKEIELLNVQIQLEKEKFPQVVAQTDLILAQTDGQRLQNEGTQVDIQQGKLAIEQSKEQIALMEEQNKQARLQTYGQDLQNKQLEQQIEINKELLPEQLKQQVISNNKLIEDTKKTDAETQYQLKQVELADIQKLTAKAGIKLMSQQLEKEKENLGLVKAQTATAMSQLALVKDQLKASKAQYSDTIDGKPIGGLLGAQITVNKVQATSYERKAFMEVISNLQAGWAANKTSDIAISSPAAYTPMVVDRALNWGLTKYFNMPADTIKLPAGYTPYLSDDEMDGKTSVNYQVG